MKKAYTYDKQEEPAVISKALSDLLLAQERPAELMALYWFYYYTAKWQDTNQAYATNGYVAEALKWSVGRVIRIGRELEQLGLIKKIASRDLTTNQISGHYVKVLFRWHQGDKATVSISHSVEKVYTNTLKTNNKTLKAKKFDPEDLPLNLSRHKKVAKAWSDFVQHRKEKKCPLTPLSWKKTINHLIEHDKDEICAAIDKAIANGWRGLFFNVNKPRHKIERDADTPALTAEGKMLLQFFIACGQEASGGISDIIAKGVKHEYMKLNKIRNPDRRDKGPMDQFNRRSFFRTWMEWLREHQQRFPIRSWRDTQVGSYRWREFLKDLERVTGYNLKTGRRVE